MQKLVAILAIVVTAAYAIQAARPYVESFFLALGAFATLASAISTLPGKLGRFGLAMGQDIERLRETKPGAKTDDPPKPPSAPTAIATGALMLVLVLLLPGCLGASSPTDRPTARSYVLLVADGVKVADVACAEAAHAIAASDRSKAIAVADACAHGYTVARQALLTAEAALDAYDSGGAGRWGCALRDGLGGLRELAAGLALAGAKVPDSVADGLALASTLSGLACAPAPDAAVGG